MESGNEYEQIFYRLHELSFEMQLSRGECCFFCGGGGVGSDQPVQRRHMFCACPNHNQDSRRHNMVMFYYYILRVEMRMVLFVNDIVDHHCLNV